MINRICPLVFVVALGWTQVSRAQTKTWDGKYETERIEVTLVYFVPKDRTPLPDWRDRLDYFSRRIELFHQREFGSQSALKTHVHAEPLVSEAGTEELRSGSADAIYFKTLREVDRRIEFAKGDRDGFPILLVLSEINWRPLDDFYRLHPNSAGELEFEGNLNNGQHFPGAASGGSRAAYLSDRGVGWGLVSADGWRVPYRGTDCVIYHEGCGHTVGLPHPDRSNGSVMSMGQYLGWINESWIDKEQKSHLQWQPEERELSRQTELFNAFTALPEPMTPLTDQSVKLKLNWPEAAKVSSIRVRIQTAIRSPWIELPQSWEGDAPQEAILGTFGRPTPISYRVDAQLDSGETAEIWGYFQVREQPDLNPLPPALAQDLLNRDGVASPTTVRENWPLQQVDLLKNVDLSRAFSVGDWSVDGGRLQSPASYAARIELDPAPPEEYRLVAIVEPLDVPNGLILGQVSGGHRFLTLFHFRANEKALSAIENIGGRNVGNETTFEGPLFEQNRPAEVIVTVKRDGVRMQVDGHTIVDWSGDRRELSLSDYWKTPAANKLFLGTYGCRYLFHRVTLEPIIP